MFMENKDNQKNETIGVKKKGNRRYSMLLLALLFIGTATYGTYAYFTDSTSVDGSIKLSAGTVSFGKLNTLSGFWQYANDEASVDNSKNITNINEKDSKDFENLQPGDMFRKSYLVEYTGSLPANITASIDEKIATAVNNSGFKYEVTYNFNTEGEETSLPKLVKTGDKITINLSVSVPFTDISEEFNEETSSNLGGKKQTLDLSNLENAVTLTVEQLKK